MNRYYKYRCLNLVFWLLGFWLAVSPVVIAQSESAVKRMGVAVKERLGVEVRTVTPREAEKYNLNAGQGLAVIWLEQGGRLLEAGFEPGDIILEFNGEQLGSLKRLFELVDSLKANAHITLLALDHRTGKTGYVQLVIR